MTVAPATYVNGLFNGDFELPNTGKISSGFDVAGQDAPGWKNAGPNQNDSGIDTAPHTGSYCAYVQKGQSGAYQITTNVMQQGSSITMTWWERNEWQSLTAKVSLLSASSQAVAFGSTTVLVSQTNALGNGNTDLIGINARSPTPLERGMPASSWRRYPERGCHHWRMGRL